MEWVDGKRRCFWANPKNPLYIRYHDEEWGVPVHDDRKLFEMLLLESFQAGLSWESILNKRENFRRAGTILGVGADDFAVTRQVHRTEVRVAAPGDSALDNARLQTG